MEIFMSTTGCPNSSFDRIPICFAMVNLQQYEIPRSIKIKEDGLLSLLALKDVKSCDDFECAKQKLINIINVYNQNVEYINKSNKKDTLFTELTHEQYSKADGTKPSYSDYHYSESLRKFKLLQTMDEEVQISQLGYLFPTLAKKITRAAERLNDRAPEGSLPFSFDLMKVESKCAHDFFAPRLRKVEIPVETPKIQLAPQEPAKESPRAETSVATPLEIADSTPASTIDVTLLTRLGTGQSLGICCEPNWDQQPISFAPCDGGWIGQVPVNQLWKFVILGEGKVTHWEQAANRRCDAQTQAFTLQANEVRF
jgi:hypothetical protein